MPGCKGDFCGFPFDEGKTMNRIAMVTLGLSFTGVLGWAAEPNADQAKAIAESKKIDGQVAVDQKSPDKPAIKIDVRQELVELKQLLSGISAQQDKMEWRLSQLEKQLRLQGEPTMKMRALGNHLMVDDHGIIWKDAAPIGVWGLNEGELKQLVSGISARQDKIERRLSQMERRLGLPGEPNQKNMRPLGKHLMVDEHSIIWKDGTPIGVWGVNGGEEQPR